MGKCTIKRKKDRKKTQSKTLQFRLTYSVICPPKYGMFPAVLLPMRWSDGWSPNIKSFLKTSDALNPHGRHMIANIQQFSSEEIIIFWRTTSICVLHCYEVLKVSNFRNVFLVSSILPKNERKQFDLRYNSRKVQYFRSYQKDISKLTDL